MATSVEELKSQLTEVGRKLGKLPTSVNVLLGLLNRMEIYLSNVEQSPPKEIQKALAPTLKAMVSDKLLRHKDVDVRVAVAYCLSEITRITAPEVPYNDDVMKEAFQLIVSSFERLDDKSSLSYNKRIAILETFARVRLCVVMLDLEFDELILEMFRHFIKTIRDYHPKTVFACMENIMIRVIEESEVISSDLLFCILEAVRKDNKEVMPVACKLVTKVIKSCADKLRESVKMAVIAKGLSLADYGGVVKHLRDETSADRVNQLEESCASAVDALIHASKSLEPIADRVNTAEETPAAVVNSTENISTDDLTHLVTRNGDAGSKDGSGEIKTDTTASIATDENPLATDGNLDAEKEDGGKSKTEPMTETIINKQGRKTKAKNCKKTTSEPKLDGNCCTDVKQPDVLAESLKSSSLCPKSTDEAAEHVSLKPSENDGVSSMGISDTKESASKFNECPQSKTMVCRLINHSSLDNKTTVSAVCGLAEGTTNPAVDASEVDATVSKADVPLDEGTTILSSDAVQEATAQKMDVTMEGVASRVEKSTEHSGAQSKHTYEGIETRGRGLGKATKNNNKEPTSTHKSAMKSDKDEKDLKETPKAITKRKRSEGNKNENKEFGEELVGSKVKVWWPADKRYYEGVIESFDSAKKKHKVLYSDGEVENLVLNKEQWEVINPDEVKHGPSTAKDYIITRGRNLAKAVMQEHAVVAENNKESTTTQKSTTKSTKYEKNSKATPRTATKRKQIEENKNENKEYGEELVGSKVKIWWPDDKRYYKGVIKSFNSAQKKHKVLYSDGDVENLVLKKERWVIINPDEESDTEEESDHETPDQEEESDHETPDAATGRTRSKKIEEMDGGTSRKRLARPRSCSDKTNSKLRNDSMSGVRAKTSSFKGEGKSKGVGVKSAGKGGDSRSVKKKDFEGRGTRSGDRNASVKSKTKELSNSKSRFAAKAHSEDDEESTEEQTQSLGRATRSSKRKEFVLSRGNNGGSDSEQKRKKGRRH